VLDDGVVDATKCTAVNTNNSVQTAGIPHRITLRSSDRFGNELLGVTDLYYVDLKRIQYLNSYSESTLGYFILTPSLQYVVQFRVTASGRYIIRLFYNGTASEESPYTVFVVPNVATASNTILNSSVAQATTTDAPVRWAMHLVDVFGNKLTQGGDVVDAVVIDGEQLDIRSLRLIDNDDGSFDIVTLITIAGSYKIAVGLGNVQQALPFSPFTLVVDAGIAIPILSSADGSSLVVGIAGNDSKVRPYAMQ
jgi:hypothetical protein